MSDDIEKSSISGLIIPIATPLDENEKVDEKNLRALISHGIAGGADGIFFGGSAGMGPLLPQEEWEKAAYIVREEVGDKAQALIGIIETSTPRALEKIKISQKAGYKNIVITPTFYITLQRDKEVVAHFEVCRDATDQDIVIYNIPSCVYTAISPAAMRVMLEKGWGAAIKESSGDAAYFRSLLLLGKEYGVNVLQGNETDIHWSLAEGAAGIVPVCANYSPQLFAQAVRQGLEGDTAGLDATQTEINELREKLLIGDHNWIAGIMGGIASLGIGNGVPIRPLHPIGDERKKLIESIKETVKTA